MPSRNPRSVKKIKQAIPEEELEDIPEDEPDGVDPDHKPFRSMSSNV